MTYPADDLDHIDGCLCDIHADQVVFTSDAELPPAHGGVELLVADAAERDGCNLDFRTGYVTADADLPIAIGGVA